MISIVVCSRTPTISLALHNSIEENTGVPYELIVIDNSHGKHSIFSAYNLGVSKTAGDLICFMHDDVICRSPHWGGAVLAHFKDPSVGMIGLGGTRYLSRIPGIWWGGGLGLIGSPKGPVCQHTIDTDRLLPEESRECVINPTGANAEDVVALDGLWLCIRRDLFPSIAFDTATFSGFHFYDLDISLQVWQAGKKLRVVHDIVVEHVAHSRHDRTWIENCFKFYSKWGHLLPIGTVEYDQPMLARIEFDNLRVFLNILKENRCLLNGMSRLAKARLFTMVRYALKYRWISLRKAGRRAVCAQ